MVMLTRLFEGDEHFGLPTRWYGELTDLYTFVGPGMTLDLRHDYMPPEIAYDFATMGVSLVIDEKYIAPNEHWGWVASQANEISEACRQNNARLYFIANDSIPIDRIPRNAVVHYDNRVDPQDLMNTPRRTKEAVMFDLTGTYDDQSLASALGQGIRIEPRKRPSNELAVILDTDNPSFDRLFRVFRDDKHYGIAAHEYSMAELLTFARPGVFLDWHKYEDAGGRSGPDEIYLQGLDEIGTEQLLWEDQVDPNLLQVLASSGRFHIIHTRASAPEFTAAAAQAGAKVYVSDAFSVNDANRKQSLMGMAEAGGGNIVLYDFGRQDVVFLQNFRKSGGTVVPRYRRSATDMQQIFGHRN